MCIGVYAIGLDEENCEEGVHRPVDGSQEGAKLTQPHWCEYMIFRADEVDENWHGEKEQGCKDLEMFL